MVCEDPAAVARRKKMQETNDLVIAVGIGVALAIGLGKAIFDMMSFKRSEGIDWNDPRTYHRREV